MQGTETKITISPYFLSAQLIAMSKVALACDVHSD